MKINTLSDFLKIKLKEMYNAENQAKKFYAAILKYITDRTLKGEIEKTVENLKQDEERISKACKVLKVKPTGKKSLIIEGLISETKEVIYNSKDQKIIHKTIQSSLVQYQRFTNELEETIKSIAQELREIEILKLYELNPSPDQELNIVKKDINKRAVHG